MNNFKFTNRMYKTVPWFEPQKAIEVINTHIFHLDLAKRGACECVMVDDFKVTGEGSDILRVCMYCSRSERTVFKSAVFDDLFDEALGAK